MILIGKVTMFIGKKKVVLYANSRNIKMYGSTHYFTKKMANFVKLRNILDFMGIWNSPKS